MGASFIGPSVERGAARPPDRLDVVAADSRRLGWPRGVDPLSAARPGARPAVLAIGDADMAFDPLSSAGIGAAVTSAEEAVPVVEGLVGGAGDAAVRSAAEARTESADGRWRAYRGRLREAYLAEDRWLDAPFWARRGG
jgi:flavin-dependent dehydrogenase